MSTTSFRPPAVPLVAIDPFFSLWSFADRLADETTRHWTGAPQPMVGMVRIDGELLLLCGSVHDELLRIDPLPQTGLEVHPTRTVYVFEGRGIRLRITFATPSFPDDLEWLGRPVGYVVFDVESIDGRPRDVTLYWDVGGEIAADSIDDPLVWARLRAGDLDILRMSSSDQRVLARSGDNRRIEWGHSYLALPQGSGETFLGARGFARKHFAEHGLLPADDDFDQPRSSVSRGPAMAAAFDLGPVGAAPVRRYFILAYDDLFSVEHMHRRLRPWWRRHGADAARLLSDAVSAFPAILHRCEAYDQRLFSEMEARGGRDYAKVCALAFRQCLAAHKLAAGADGAPVYFSKENFSNGCIATVDVTYPSSPFFLWLNPGLLRAQIDPILSYAASPKWRFPFAPHDLGVYPLANGQVYGGAETSEEYQMPVEECGNMLILVTALVLRTGDMAYARKWRGLLGQWAGYLEEKGMDPENQLCTDDFAGHLAHNANLSLKAIVALGAYARLCAGLGEAEEAGRVGGLAREMAARWREMADDGGHYRLAFDAPGSWSQKYNLVWDSLLGLGLFPPEVARREVASYKARLNRHGLPLDSRRTYTKLDWIFWSATLAENDEDFRALIAPSCAWVSEGSSRVPLTDWHETVGEGRMVGFQARSVVGGLFLPLLAEMGGTVAPITAVHACTR